MESKIVRTRFAPSPTGYLHVGGIRTALFAWLVARQNGGQFILRIEDTDKAREVEGSIDHIVKSLQALGLDFDEGPFKQSDRLDIYKQWAQKLIDSDKAYADPYTAEEVQAFRDAAAKNKQAFLYRNHRPDSPPKWDGSQPLRFKSNPQAYTWQDQVMGQLSTGPEVIDDFILIKSDGYPTYNFAHIVDDAEMGITHIIRAQEFIASVPNYLNLYEALELSPPILATAPPILGPDGNKKLSKRDGAKDVLDYIREGFLPDALINFIASLGWNDGTEQEIFSRDELIKKFSLDHVQRSGARFDEQRLLWMNGSYIRELPLEKLYELSKDFWPKTAQQASEEEKKNILAVIQERLKFLAEIPSLTSFFFEDLPIDLKLITQNKQLGAIGKPELKQLLEKSYTAIEQSSFSVEDLTNTLNALLQETGQKPAVLFSLIRVATTWAPSSPGLADTLALLGKDKTLQRMQKAIDALGE